MPKCLSCGCEIDENNEPNDTFYQGGYCNLCSIAEEEHSKEGAELYDTYISTLYSQEEEPKSHESGEKEDRSEYEVLYANEDMDEEGG